MTASSPNGDRAAAIKANFESTCDCTVEWVALADGVAMLNRLKLEGKDTQADVVLGLDTNLTDEARGLNLFAPTSRCQPAADQLFPAAGAMTSSCPLTTAISPLSMTARR
jgi:ABC-type thiamine transport system substrate-binding protein